MKLVFLHGAPATGKLTVARALIHATSGRLLDNHAAIDFARTMFDFGAPGFWDLVHQIRLAALAAAARQEISLVVMTFCYSPPGDRPCFEAFDALTKQSGGELLPVFLYCSDEEIARRISNPDRIEKKKVASMDALNGFRLVYNDAPVPRANCLKLNTEIRTAQASAEEIIHHFGLAERAEPSVTD
jgi:hypothetical protein